MGKCNWCGKEIGSSVGVCSNKCQAESDSYHGISPAERAKSDKDSRSCVGCLMGFIVITYLIAATFFPFFTRKLLPSSDYVKLTPWDKTVAIPVYKCEYCQDIKKRGADDVLDNGSCPNSANWDKTHNYTWIYND